MDIHYIATYIIVHMFLHASGFSEKLEKNQVKSTCINQVRSMWYEKTQ